MYPEDSELNRLLTEREGHLARLNGDTNGSVSVFSDEFTTERSYKFPPSAAYHWDILQYSTTLLCAATFVDDVPLLAATRIPTSTKSFQKMSIDVNHRIETWEWSHVAKFGPVEDGSLWIGCLQMPYSQVERYLLVSKMISYIYYSFKIVAAKYEHSRVRSE